MCFGGGQQPQAPTNPATTSLDDSQSAVTFTKQQLADQNKAKNDDQQTTTTNGVK